MEAAKSRSKDDGEPSATTRRRRIISCQLQEAGHQLEVVQEACPMGASADEQQRSVRGQAQSMVFFETSPPPRPIASRTSGRSPSSRPISRPGRTAYNFVTPTCVTTCTAVVGHDVLGSARRSVKKGDDFCGARPKIQASTQYKDGGVIFGGLGRRRRLVHRQPDDPSE